MKLKILFERPLGRPREKSIEAAITAALEGHPLFECGATRPSELTVRVAVGMDKRTAVNHSSYPVERRIDLDLDELYYHLDSKIAEPLFQGDSSFHTKFPNLLAHEFSHFIDARLSPWFGYADAKRPGSGRSLSIMLNLWDAYIDGRLGSLAPHTLLERQREASEVNRLDASLVARAWSGDFRTFDALVSVAVEAARAQSSGA